MNEACHIWMSYVTHEWVMSYTNKSCHICADSFSPRFQNIFSHPLDYPDAIPQNAVPRDTILKKFVRWLSHATSTLCVRVPWESCHICMIHVTYLTRTRIHKNTRSVTCVCLFVCTCVCACHRKSWYRKGVTSHTNDSYHTYTHTDKHTQCHPWVCLCLFACARVHFTWNLCMVEELRHIYMVRVIYLTRPHAQTNTCNIIYVCVCVYLHVCVCVSRRVEEESRHVRMIHVTYLTAYLRVRVHVLRENSVWKESHVTNEWVMSHIWHAHASTQTHVMSLMCVFVCVCACHEQKSVWQRLKEETARLRLAKSCHAEQNFEVWQISSLMSERTYSEM